MSRQVNPKQLIEDGHKYHLLGFSNLTFFRGTTERKIDLLRFGFEPFSPRLDILPHKTVMIQGAKDSLAMRTVVGTLCKQQYL